jgi:hypothetical protein
MNIGDKVRVRAELNTVAPKDEEGVVESFEPDADPHYPFTVYFPKDDTHWSFSEDELEVL